MLIKVFGIWLMAANVAMLDPTGKDCEVVFVSGGSYSTSSISQIVKASCDKVAAEINRQVKGE